jgi:hypothetical protein
MFRNHIDSLHEDPNVIYERLRLEAWRKKNLFDTPLPNTFLKHV